MLSSADDKSLCYITKSFQLSLILVLVILTDFIIIPAQQTS